jgi:hypothetical protein
LVPDPITIKMERRIRIKALQIRKTDTMANLFFFFSEVREFFDLFKPFAEPVDPDILTPDFAMPRFPRQGVERLPFGHVALTIF